MNPSEVLRTFILADPALAAALGTRVYPIKLPQTVTYPAMTIQEISGTALPPLKGRASLARPRFQCDVWVWEQAPGNPPAEVQRIGQLLSDRLEGAVFTVQDDDASPAKTLIVALEFETQRETYETDVNGGFYRYSADYFVHHQTGHGT